MATTLFEHLSDQRVAAQLSGRMLILLAARGMLPMHGAVLFGGLTNGRGTNTLNFPQVGLFGYDRLTPVAEGAQIVPIRLTDAVSNLSPVRMGKAYEPSDTAKWTDPQGVFSTATMAQDAVATLQATQLALLSALAPAFTAQAGTTTADLTAATHLGARIALEMANVPGPYLACYHSRQIGDLAVNALASTGGAFQWSKAASDVMSTQGWGGEFLGVDIYRSNHQPLVSAGADRSGMMFGPGAVVWGALRPEPEAGVPAVVLADLIMVERGRDDLAGITRIVQSANMDFQIAINGAGVEVISGAT